MTIYITRQLIDDAMTEAVASKGPDYVYPGVSIDEDDSPKCVYMVPGTGEASCLVGAALVRIIPDLTSYLLFDEEEEDENPNTMGINALVDHLERQGVHVDDDALELMGVVQRNQDTMRVTWADALAHARVREVAVTSSGEDEHGDEQVTFDRWEPYRPYPRS